MYTKAIKEYFVLPICFFVENHIPVIFFLLLLQIMLNIFNCILMSSAENLCFLIQIVDNQLLTFSFLHCFYHMKFYFDQNRFD